MTTPVEYPQVEWDDQVERKARHLVELALEEDLDGQRDWTTWASIPAASQGQVQFVNRVPGVVAGLPILPIIVEQLLQRDPATGPVVWSADVEDGTVVERGTCLGRLQGNAGTILQVERTALNFLGRLSGIATLTHQFATRIAGTRAKIYDTRKTTPGWRLLEKYAVRCGGGQNHRLGLYAAVMLKDNHLAEGDDQYGEELAGKIERTQQRLKEATDQGVLQQPLIFEVEVDDLQQLETIIELDVDIILLDNMEPDRLHQAVQLRNRKNPRVQLEASGGVNLDSVAAIAATGVERISSGALTHSAINWDVGLDWVD